MIHSSRTLDTQADPTRSPAARGRRTRSSQTRTRRGPSVGISLGIQATWNLLSLPAAAWLWLSETLEASAQCFAPAAACAYTLLTWVTRCNGVMNGFTWTWSCLCSEKAYSNIWTIKLCNTFLVHHDESWLGLDGHESARRSLRCPSHLQLEMLR